VVSQNQTAAPRRPPGKGLSKGLYGAQRGGRETRFTAGEGSQETLDLRALLTPNENHQAGARLAAFRAGG
jgi:hypothetical protein